MNRVFLVLSLFVFSIVGLNSSSYGAPTYKGLKFEIQARKAALEAREAELERRKAAIGKQKAELDEWTSLTRIPEILEEFCQNNPPEALVTASGYLSEFASCFLQGKLSKSHDETELEEKSGELNRTCRICTDQIYGDEKFAAMECGHIYHSECIGVGIQFYLEEEKPQLLTSCPVKGCNYKFSPANLASFVRYSDHALRIQKLFVRSVDGLKFCPSCGEGIAKHGDQTGFGQKCQHCHEELCFSCGQPSHSNIPCVDLTDEGSKRSFVLDLLKKKQEDRYGFCPHCRALVEKHYNPDGSVSGCDDLVCGNNAQDKREKFGSIRNSHRYGCGREFYWNDRIRLADFLAGSQSEPSPESRERNRRARRAAPEIPATTNNNPTGDNEVEPWVLDAIAEIEANADRQFQRPGIQALAAPAVREETPALTLEEQQRQAGIIPIDANVPRVRDFPDFAGSGDLYYLEPLDLLLSVTPQTLRQNYSGANAYCRDLDGGRNWVGMRTPGGATAPTREQGESIFRVMGRGTERGYNPNLIPGIGGRWFWSSSPNDDYVAYRLSGNDGSVYPGDRNFEGSVLCVRPLGQRG